MGQLPLCAANECSLSLQLEQPEPSSRRVKIRNSSTRAIFVSFLIPENLRNKGTSCSTTACMLGLHLCLHNDRLFCPAEQCAEWFHRRKELGQPSIWHLLSFPTYMHDVLHRVYRIYNGKLSVNPVHNAVREWGERWRMRRQCRKMKLLSSISFLHKAEKRQRMGEKN